IVMPEQDAVLAITAETPDMQEEINLVWQYLLPAFKANRVPTDAGASARLKQKIESLTLPPPQKNSQPISIGINGKTFTTSSNALHVQDISFDFSDDLCKVKFHTDTASYQIAFANGNVN